METKKPSSNATRKVSRKDGRYLDSYVNKPSSKSNREKSSRSPLRVTTLESNVKSSGHVGFREPLASYREIFSASSTERSPVWPAATMTVDGQQLRDFDSTRSSAVDETSVRYLNDRPAIDALEGRLQGPHSDIVSASLVTDHRANRPPDTSQPTTSFSPSSHRLETLKRRQPDAKLEKLKERIRRQWEMSGERDVKERVPSSTNYTENVISAKTRKVASAPPPPVYKGFNPPETKIRTPDGKLWQEEDFHNLSAQLYGSLLSAPQDKMSNNEKSGNKRSSRPVRKVQRLAGAGGLGSPESKTVKGVISTSSWRDGQKLVKQILGPAPKIEKESKALPSDRRGGKGSSSTDRHTDKRPVSSERNSDKRPAPTERERDKRPNSKDRQTDKRGLSRERQTDNQDRSFKSVGYSLRSESGHQIDKSCKDPIHSTSSSNSNTKSHIPLDSKKHLTESTEVKKDFLPMEIRGILDDLQLDSGVDVPKRTRSRSPTKRKPEKGHVPEEPQVSSKRRHYDTEQVRLYILRQQEERKKRQNEEREAHRLAEEQKNKRLRELYQKQKEAFRRARTGNPRLQEKEEQELITNKPMEPNSYRLQESHARLLLGQTWPEPTAQERQTKPLYQPSGESDKENKGQERPPSTSSSSDLSLSEPLQPLLRSDLMDTHCRQLDRFTSKGPLPQSLSQTPGGAGIFSQLLTIPTDLETLLSSRKSANGLESHKTGLQGKPTTNDFRSNLDRIETLKATAVSLSSRIESEAKKLAGGPLAFQSAWDAPADPMPQAKITWRKPDSPPERESGEDVFSARIQKMLGTCTTHFSQKDLPGANSLYKKLPDELQLQTAPLARRCEGREEEPTTVKRDGKNGRPPDTPNNASPSQNSSTSSISEGPLLSEGSLSEGEGVPSRGSPLNPAEALKSKEFCVKEAKSFEPITEFQREADKYLPLPSSIGSNVKGPWEELAKGSPNSVINIFTRSYQLYGKALEGQSKESLPELQPRYAATSSQDNISYEEDFVSSSFSEPANDLPKMTQSSVDTSASSIKEELPLAKLKIESPHSSSAQSAASSPASSSSQRGSKQRKGWQNGTNQVPLEHDHSSSGSDHKGQGNKSAQSLSPGKERPTGSDTDSTIGELSSRSMASLLSDSGKALRSHHSSFRDASGQSPTSPVLPTAATSGSQAPGLQPGSVQGSMRFSPAALQQRMSAELNYLTAMEESDRQLRDVERARGISLAQQETVSLAQIMKAQQQRYEQSMAALRQQTEQEACQKAVQAQAEILQRFQKTLESSTTYKAHRMQEELDHGYLSPVSSDPAVPSLMEQQKKLRPHVSRKKGSHSASPSSQPNSSSSSFREHPHSNSSGQESPPAASVLEATISQSELEESIAEDLESSRRGSIPEDLSTPREDKSTSSAHTVKGEGMEDVSFRSLLPSESHRRGSLERQRSQRHESDEESTPDKELSGPFSSGQDSFWRFTMEMVRQYMQEGEMRSAHQAALLRLRQRALKDKTKAELAWLEHQKRRLRDKGEDDKMPPLRKRQRGLLLRLQQEQAEIKRLQEANKAARRERQLILKQQEEIQRIQNSTLRLQEKLKSAESGQLELPSEGAVQPSPAYSNAPSDAESRSPSPVSVSGSETSSIMQKLRKMHGHMDAKDICPVHCFFSVFTPQHWASLSVCFPKLHPKFQLYICRQLLRFLTKREQQLVQRRLHAQELLEWKRRLDAEELEIRRIEKQVLAAWDSQTGKPKSQSIVGRETVEEEKEMREESQVPLSPPMHTKTSGSSIPEYVPSESIEPSTIAEQIQEQSAEHSSISEDLPVSPSSKGSPRRSSKSIQEEASIRRNLNTGSQQLHKPLRGLSHTWSEESLSMTHSETTSDQSDIECRIRALKDELRKRKSVVDNLKREQKRRQKERLRAKEAILRQQLQSYDEFIRKTQAELSGDQGTKTSPKAAVIAKEAIDVRPETTIGSDTTSVLESEKHVEISATSDGSFSPKRSLSNEVVESESIPEQSLHATVSAKEDASSEQQLHLLSEHQSRPQSSSLVDQLLSSTNGSPVSSIHSEIPEEVLETQSNRSMSPIPALNLNVRTSTPDEILSPHKDVSLSPHKDVSYSEDFETSATINQSVSETPREELPCATTPGRDIPFEGEHEEECSESRSESPHSQSILENNYELQEPPIAGDTFDPLAGFLLGDRVLVSGVQPGTLRFKGKTLFADGIWAGVELDKSEGNNDGAHGGNRYFTCPHQHGIFAPPHKISHVVEEQVPTHTDQFFSGERTFEHKEEVDGYFSPSVDVQETKDLEIDMPKSTESSISELLSTAIEDNVPKCDLQLDLPIETITPDDEGKKSQTPLLDLLIQEQNQLSTSSEQAQEVSAISESLLQICLKDTVTYLQNLRKQRAEKIRQSNEELQSSPTVNDLYNESEKTSNEDQRPQSVPVFDDYNEKDLPVLEPSQSLLPDLEEPDWFDEDFGLSSRRVHQQEQEHAPSPEPTPEPCLLVPHPGPAPKPMMALAQPEPFMAVPHSAPEVKQLVGVAVDELWRWKHMRGDLQEIRTIYIQTKEDEQSPASCAYKSVVFDLTLHIFDEICSPDPRGSQPLWKKPLRVSPSYARRVKNPHNLQEVKSFLTDEVLILLSLKKEQNQKTDWQRMMKFGRKKRDRVDHILVQELHEEEAQWVNYDEDELFVKMQLADGIFEALLLDTVHVLQNIQEKRNCPLLV
ncbi:centrosome-associated protein 350 [Discoglossus pictus]